MLLTKLPAQLLNNKKWELKLFRKWIIVRAGRQMCHRLHERQPRKHGEKQNTNILEMLWCKFLCRNFIRSDPSIQKESIFWPHRNKEIRGKIDIHKSQKSYGVYFWAAISWDFARQFISNMDPQNCTVLRNLGASLSHESRLSDGEYYLEFCFS